MSSILIQEQLKKFSIEKPDFRKSIEFREGRWTKEEHNIFLEETLRIGIKNWKKLEERIKTRNNCQIRSHFQKYLKKICSKYNLKRKISLNFNLGTLTEIFIDEKNLSKINEVDRRIIEIFNSYKKNQGITRKSKMRALFKKRLAKKKFFKIKRVDEEGKKSFEENPVNNSPMKSLPNNHLVTNLNELTNCTTLLDGFSGSKKYICQKFEEVALMNKIFIKNFLNFNYDYENTMKLFQSFLCYNFVFSRSFESDGRINKNN